MKTNFKIYPKAEYDKIFEEIKAIPVDWEPQKIVNFIKEKINFPLTFAHELSEEMLSKFPIYRARVQKVGEKKIDENDVKEFSYQPNPELCEMRRCNRKWQQVFYGAGDENTAIYESKKDIIVGESIVYLSNWEIKECSEPVLMHMLFYGLPEDTDNYASIMSTSLNKSILEMFQNIREEVRECLFYYLKKYQELFTSSNEQYYHISSSIIHEIFEELSTKQISNKNDRFVNMPIVSYPSVAKYRTTVNFVL
ncbi:MAG: hypothetical protein H0W84_02175 [Bacteroidetes bacterium]|nr:hypothetical protein [Bacteroidota bacterium]